MVLWLILLGAAIEVFSLLLVVPVVSVALDTVPVSGSICVVAELAAVT